MPLFILIAIVLLLTIIGGYNGIVGLENRVANAWAQIEVQLKKRADLVPNLVETVKGYATHERQTLEAVVAARNASVASPTLEAKVENENVLSGALRQLFAIAEAYPDLKANQNFLRLQEDLTGIENKLAYTRQAYNDAVLLFNNRVEMFPSSLIASWMGKKEKLYFEVEPSAQEVPQVKF